MRRLVLGGVWFLAALQAVVGLWAQVLPVSFFTDFPFGPPGWAGMLPPYNEHLVRDVGGLNLAVTVVLIGAALRGDRFTVRLAVAAALVYAVPHAVFHQTHLEHFPPSAAILQTIGITAQLAIAVAVWVLAARLPHTALRWSATGSTTDPARRSR